MTPHLSKSVKPYKAKYRKLIVYCNRKEQTIPSLRAVTVR